MSYENTRAEAAQWMYSREVKDNSGAHFWRHTVFTKDNPDRKTLGHTHMMAYQIFGDLVDRGLLIALPEDGTGPKYMINHARDAEWKAIMYHHSHFFKQIAANIGNHILSGIIGAVIGTALTALVAWSLCSK
jgi:hypothetical protein